MFLKQVLEDKNTDLFSFRNKKAKGVCVWGGTEEYDADCEIHFFCLMVSATLRFWIQ